MLSLLTSLSLLLTLVAAQSPSSSAPLASATASASPSSGPNRTNTTDLRITAQDGNAIPSLTIGGSGAFIKWDAQNTSTSLWLRNPDPWLMYDDFGVSGLLPGSIAAQNGIALPAGTLPGDNYTFVLCRDTNRSDVLVTSDPFPIYAADSTSNNATPQGVTYGQLSPPHGLMPVTFSLPSPHYYWVAGKTGMAAWSSLYSHGGSSVDLWLANANATLLPKNYTIVSSITPPWGVSGVPLMRNTTAGYKYFLIMTPHNDTDFTNAMAYSSYFDIKRPGTELNFDDSPYPYPGKVTSGALRMSAGYAALLGAALTAALCAA